MRVLATLALAAALAVSGCGAPKRVAEGVDEEDHGRSSLHDNVRAALAELADAPCVAAPAWEILDDPEAGERLDEALAKGGGCEETIAAARAVRRIRLDELDLDGDLAHPSPVVRAVTIRHAAAADLPGAAKKIRPLLTDADERVTHVARRALVVLGALTPRERPTMARLYGEDEPQEPRTCEELILSLESGDSAERASTLGRLLREHFHRFATSLDNIGTGSTYGERCRLPDRLREQLLSADSPSLVRGLASAILLWRRHPDLSVLRPSRERLEEMQRLLSTGMRRCTDDDHCAPDGVCIALAGAAEPGGVCGYPVSRRGQRWNVRTRVVYASACWTFGDCPPFYTCSIGGFCVRDW